MNGVARCIVGYSGGIEPSPNYRNMKVRCLVECTLEIKKQFLKYNIWSLFGLFRRQDYTESLLIEFDQTVVSYEAILKEVGFQYFVSLPPKLDQYECRRLSPYLLIRRLQMDLFVLIFITLVVQDAFSVHKKGKTTISISFVLRFWRTAWHG